MRIAIVRISALGDIIQSMIVVQFIKKKYPRSTIDWVVDKKFSEIVRLNKLVDNVIELEFDEIKRKRNFFLLAKTLAGVRKFKKYDYVIDIQGLLKSAIVSKLIPSKNTVGFDRKSSRESITNFFYSITCNVPYQSNVIERYCAIVSKALHVNINKKDILYKEPLFSFSQKEQCGKPVISIVIGASFESKIYPVDNYELIVNYFDARFICLWGNKYEYNLAKKFSNKNPKVEIAKKTSLTDLLRIISTSDIVIGGDTGPTHLAWALNIPSITLFGSTPGYRNMFETSKNLKLESNSIVDPRRIDKNDFSIRQIPPEAILNCVKELLKN